jgi:hypothetical protein
MGQWSVGPVLLAVTIALFLGQGIWAGVRRTWRAAIVPLLIALALGLSLYSTGPYLQQYPWWRGALWLALALLFLWRELFYRPSLKHQ